jgi:predicted dehydrogenase
MPPELPRSDHPLCVGIISPGRWGKKLLDAVVDSEALAFGGIFSRDSSNSAQVTASHGGRTYSSYDKLLEDPQIEAVIIPTPHFLHHDQGIAALAAGKHIFVEKPLATTVEDAEALAAASRRYDRVLAVGHQARHTTAAQRVRAMLQADDFGPLASLVVVQGFPLLLNTSPDNWRTREENLPGGPLDEFGVHYFDVLQFWCGPVRRVSGFINRQLTPGNVPDSVTACLEFMSGVIASYTAHFVSVGLSRVTIYGSKGALELNRFGDLPSWWQPVTDMTTARDGGGAPEPVDFGPPSLVTTALRAELEDFANAIRHGRTPAVGAPEALSALRISRAILESSSTGRTVTLPDA